MLTLIYALFDGVVGMEITLIGYGLCAVLYFVICFLFRCNRSGKGRVLIGWLVCELICDVLWYVIYYPDGYYVNYGIGGAAGMLLWPAALVGAAAMVSSVNANRYSKNADAE